MKKKKELKNLIASLVAGVLAFAASITVNVKRDGINVIKNDDEEKQLEEQLEEQISENNQASKASSSEQELEYFPTQDINTNYNSFLNGVEKIVPNYNFAEEYLSQEEVKEIIEKSKNNSECSYELSGSLDEEIEKLYLQIKNNSLELLEVNSELSSPFVTSGENDNQTIIFDKAFKEALREVLSEATNDVAEDICRLSDLKVLLTDIVYYRAYFYPDKNVICFDVNEIFQRSLSTDKDEQINYLKKVIKIMLNYTREYTCEHREIDELNSISYSAYHNTIQTAAAESSIIYSDNYLDDNYISYEEIKDESLLLLLALFNEDASLSDYYNAIFDADLQSLYRFFDLKNEEDIYNFYKILYAIDTSNSKSDLYNIILSDSRAKNYNDTVELLGFSYRTDIFKLTLKRLADYTSNHQDFSLEDNLRIFEIIKNLVVRNTHLLEKEPNENEPEYKIVYDATFAQEVVTLENMYVEFLSKIYNVSETEIRTMEEKIAFDVAEMDVTNDDSEKNAEKEKLYQRFPILKGILETNIIWGYKSFLEDNNITTNQSR